MLSYRPMTNRFALLKTMSEIYYDAQVHRIGISNRFHSIEVPKDTLEKILVPARAVEDAAAKEMKKAFITACPEIHAWVKETTGLGEHTMARLLGAIGDPYIATPHTWVDGSSQESSQQTKSNADSVQDQPLDQESSHQSPAELATASDLTSIHQSNEISEAISKSADGSSIEQESNILTKAKLASVPARVVIAGEPYKRTLRQLWRYCCVGDPADKRRKGMSQEDAMKIGKPQVGMLLQIIAEGCIKCVGSEPSLSQSIYETTANNGSVDSISSDQESNDVPIAELVSVPDQVSSVPESTTSASSRTGNGSGRKRSPYRDVYDEGRARYATREGWSLMRQHNAALRLVKKEILRDLWKLQKAVSD